MLNVDVTNGDGAPHSVLVQAAFVERGDLVGLAIGLVHDIAGAQTKTASLSVIGQIPAYGKVLL